LHSYLLINGGNGRFEAGRLPSVAQASILNGMIAEDFDGDGNLDLVAGGNDFGTDLAMGKYDALNGLYLKGSGKGSFQPLSILQSGVYLPGNTKALVKLRGPGNQLLIAAGENKGPLKLLELRASNKLIPVLHNDVSAILKLKNGKTRKTDLNHGSSFLSQSGRFVVADKNISSVIITNSLGVQRTIEVQ
ncbi:MAG: VCBS repeat-containing protein, partial [Sphingobacteriales bacterium]